MQPLAVRLLAGRDRSTVLAVSMLLAGAGIGLGTIAHGSVGYAGSVLVWTLGEIGVAVMFGATFADLAPADLRGRYMGVASTTWSIGAVFGPLSGTILLDHAGRTTLSVACVATGIALFAAQLAVTPALRVRTSPQGRAAASAATSGNRKIDTKGNTPMTTMTDNEWRSFEYEEGERD